MAVRIESISSTMWSPKLGAPGEIVTGVADIEQCMDIIVSTPPGSDPHRPLFGCAAWRWLDKPAAIAVPNIIREVTNSLEMWEPRIDVVSVTYQLNVVTVVWQPKGETTAIKKEISLANTAL